MLDKVIETTSRYNWSFIFTGERATRLSGEQRASRLSSETVYLKDLKKVYRRKVRPELICTVSFEGVYMYWKEGYRVVHITHR